MPNFRYEMAETTLEPGETVVLYTDGVTDAMNSRRRTLRRRSVSPGDQDRGTGATGVGDAVVKAVQGHVAERPQFDDITLVCLARK